MDKYSSFIKFPKNLDQNSSKKFKISLILPNKISDLEHVSLVFEKKNWREIICSSFQLKCLQKQFFYDKSHALIERQKTN